MDDRPADSRERPGLLERAWPVGAIYLALSVAMTFPLILHMADHAPAGAVDLWQNVWNFWWWKRCLFEGLHPYASPYLFHPTGADLAFYTHSVFNMIATAPVNLLAGPVAAYNASVLLALWLSGWFAWMWLKEATGDARGAFLGGLVFTFFPQHMEQTLEHLNLFSTQFIPLSLLFLHRLARKGGLGPAVGLGVAYALNALCDWHLAVMTTLLLAPLAALELARPSGERARARREMARDLAIAGAIATVLVLPFALPLVRGLAQGMAEAGGGTGAVGIGPLGSGAGGAAYFQKAAEDRGIDALYLVLPQFAHPIWGRLTLAAYERRAYEAAGFTCFLGFVPLALAGRAVVQAFRSRRARSSPSYRNPGERSLVAIWGVVFIVALVLSLGARPWFDGRLIEDLPLPFALFRSVPVLSLLRIANRFMIFVALAMAVLVCVGQASGLSLRGARAGSRDDMDSMDRMDEMEGTDRPLDPRPSNLRVVLLSALVLLEYLWLPYPTRPLDLSPGLRAIADSPDRGAVLDVPFNGNGKTVRNMVAQTVHGRPIAGGYLSTVPPGPVAFLRAEPTLSDLVGADVIGIEPAFARPIDPAALRALGFGHAILHKDARDGAARKARAALRPETSARDLFDRKTVNRMGGIPDAKFDAIRRDFERACGPPVFEDGRMAIFHLP